MEEVTTLFDSDEAEYEYMKEQEAKRRKAEKEYIDREWLLNEGIRVTSGYNNDGVIMIPMRDVRESIKNAPAADVVCVVRCKDCIHCRNLPNGLCYAWTEPTTTERGYKGEVHCVEPDDFCSMGQRKEQTDG